MSRQRPLSRRRESNVWTASIYALFLMDMAEICPDGANFRPDARQTESDFQQFLRSLKAY